MWPVPDRLASLALVAALAAVVPGGGPASAAEVGEGRSLCDVVSLDALNALSPLRYAEPVGGTPNVCDLVASPDQAGPHVISIVYEELPLEQTFDELKRLAMAHRSGITEVTIAGQPGYVDGSSVIVGLDDHFLSVSAEVAGSAEAGDIDPAEHAVDVAELVVPALLAGDGAEDEAVGLVDVVAPPSVRGIRWAVTRDWEGEEVAARTEQADVAEAGLWTAIIEAGGATLDQVHVLEATAHDALSDHAVGTYSALRVEGVDAASLEPVLLDWLGGLGDAADVETEERTIGGKVVTAVSSAGQPRLVHATGDTLYVIRLPDRLAARLLERLP